MTFLKTTYIITILMNVNELEKIKNVRDYNILL